MKYLLQGYLDLCAGMTFHSEMNRANANPFELSLRRAHFRRIAEWLVGAVKLPIRREVLGCAGVEDPMVWGAIRLAGDIRSCEECKMSIFADGCALLRWLQLRMFLPACRVDVANFT